jgi:hypothetical protein
MARLEGNERRARRCLATVIGHAASESADVDAARRMLADRPTPYPRPSLDDNA